MVNKILFGFLLSALCGCQALKESRFHVCKNRQMFSSPVLETINTQSDIRCAAACADMISCRSANYIPNNGTCELLPNVTFYDDCETVGQESTGEVLKKFVPQCIYGGEWNWTLSHCVGCDYGFSGRNCERRIIDCTEGQELGYTRKPGILIQPINAKKAFLVRCDFDLGATFVGARDSAIKCKPPYVTFNRTWYDYKHGFGSIWCDYFIGLENLHLLTLQRRTYLTIRLKNGTGWIIVMYNDFVIDNEENNYTMHFINFNSSTTYPGGDGFGMGAPNASVNHSPFCTPDRDCRSCAMNSASGWWFNTACAEINLHIPLDTALKLQWPAENNTKKTQEKFKLSLLTIK